jgi:hypothetical protein
MIKSNLYFFVFLSVLSLFSCYEEKEGCLDIFASNYDVSADFACMECCDYPTASLDLSHTFNNEPYKLNDSIANNINSYFKVISQKIFISDIFIFDGKEKIDFIINETYTFNDGKKEKKPKNYTLIDANSKINPFANIRYSGKCDSIELRLGMSDYYDDIKKNVIPSSYEIAPQSDMIVNDKFASMKFTILTGISFKDTIKVDVFGDKAFKIKISPTELLKGKSSNIILPPFKYEKLFKDIQFKKGDQSKIEKQININMSDFI